MSASDQGDTLNLPSLCLIRGARSRASTRCLASARTTAPCSSSFCPCWAAGRGATAPSSAHTSLTNDDHRRRVLHLNAGVCMCVRECARVCVRVHVAARGRVWMGRVCTTVYAYAYGRRFDVPSHVNPAVGPWSGSTSDVLGAVRRFLRGRRQSARVCAPRRHARGGGCDGTVGMRLLRRAALLCPASLPAYLPACLPPSLPPSLLPSLSPVGGPWWWRARPALSGRDAARSPSSRTRLTRSGTRARPTAHPRPQAHSVLRCQMGEHGRFASCLTSHPSSIEIHNEAA